MVLEQATLSSRTRPQSSSEHAVGYLSLPGHTDETASRVMPLVRFPLVSLLPPSAGAQCIMLPPSVHRQLKAMQERNVMEPTRQV